MSRPKPAKLFILNNSYFKNVMEHQQPPSHEVVLEVVCYVDFVIAVNM